MGRCCLVLLAPGFEEIEAICPIDLLRRAEVEVLVASASTGLLVRGRSGISLQADCLLSDVSEESFDLLVLPGGPAVYDLRKQPEILALISRFHNDSVPIGAICAAPLLLLDAGILPGPAFTAHGSTVDELPDLQSGQETLVSGSLVTSRGAGTAVSFGLALVEILKGADIARQIRESIHA